MFEKRLWYDGNMEKKKGKKIENKVLVGVLVGLVVVIVGLVVGLVIVQMNGGGDAGNDLGEDADNLSQIGYREQMERKIESASSVEEKGKLYQDLAAGLWAYNSSKDNPYMDEIMGYIYKSEELNPTMHSAQWIYYFEYQLGNMERAEEYKKLAEERGFDETYEDEQ